MQVVTVTTRHLPPVYLANATIFGLISWTTIADKDSPPPPIPGIAPSRREILYPVSQTCPDFAVSCIPQKMDLITGKISSVSKR